MNERAMAGREEDPDNDMGRRLDQLNTQLQARENAAKAERAKATQDNRGMAYGLKIASEFVSAVLVGSAIGWVLDYYVGTTPFGLIVFLMLGFAAGVVNVMRTTGKMAEPDDKK
ncbi:MAG: AtpZ/AtpI family protein [Pseudomonadota bacterium]